MATLSEIKDPRHGTYKVDVPFTHNGRTWRIVGRDRSGYLLRNEETGKFKTVTEQDLKQAER